MEPELEIKDKVPSIEKATADFLMAMYLQGSCQFELLSVTNDGYGGLKFLGRIHTTLLPRAECRTTIYLHAGAVGHFRKNPNMSIKEYYVSQERMLNIIFHIETHIAFTMISKDGEDFYMLQDIQLIPGLGTSHTSAFLEIQFMKDLWTQIERDTFGVANSNLKSILAVY